VNLPCAYDQFGLPAPINIGMSTDAKKRWVAFHDDWSLRFYAMDGAFGACDVKLKSYAARFALLDHVIRFVPRAEDCQQAIQLASIEVGIKAAEWFGREARRVYALLSQDKDQRKVGDLIDLIRRKGGGVTARELQQSSRHYPTSADANAALDRLGKAGLGN